jgi:hypothetical protein
MLLIRHLERLPDHFRKYAGTLNIFSPVDLRDFLAIARAFRDGVGKRFGECVQYRPVAELGPDSGRLHLHYAMTSDGVDVEKAAVRAIWSAACGGCRVNVDHGSMRDVGTWTRYLFKADEVYHDPGNPAECVKLFAKYAPRLPQATRDFFPGKVKAAHWREWKKGA